MRRLACLTLLLALTAAVPGVAAAAPRLTVEPGAVKFGQAFTVRGRGWPVIEFCSRTVRISLRSDQNAFRIGTVRTRRNGRFRFEYTPRRSRVGAGSWRVVARMRCESGDDGSPVLMRASGRIRIGTGPKT